MGNIGLKLKYKIILPYTEAKSPKSLAERPPPPQSDQQQLLMAAEEIGEYF